MSTTVPTATYFDAHGPNGLYARVRKQNFLRHQELTASTNRILINQSREKPITVLDLGCGSADYISRAFEGANIFMYTGIDSSPESISAAQRNLEGLHSDIYQNFITGDFTTEMQGIINAVSDRRESLPSNRDTRYDVIVSSYAQHHLKTLDEKRAFMKQVWKLLELDGVFLLTDIVNEYGNRDQWLEAFNTEMDAWAGTSEDEVELLTPSMVQASKDHVGEFDFPESIQDLTLMGIEEEFSPDTIWKLPGVQTGGEKPF